MSSPDHPGRNVGDQPRPAGRRGVVSDDAGWREDYRPGGAGGGRGGGSVADGLRDRLGLRNGAGQARGNGRPAGGGGYPGNGYRAGAYPDDGQRSGAGRVGAHRDGGNANGGRYGDGAHRDGGNGGGYRDGGRSARAYRGAAFAPDGPYPGGGYEPDTTRRRGDDGRGRGGRGAPPRRKGSWWRHWTWRKALAICGCSAVAVVIIGIIAVVTAYSSTPVPTDVLAAARQQSSNVYFGNGKSLVGTFSTGTNRQLLQSNQIPTVLKKAVVAAEDRHFYTEGGISPTGILRAAYEDTIGGGTFQGASTITQQFVRNYYSGIGTAETASRKVKEIFVAIKLSREKSKDWILTQYLNTVYLGNQAYGVGAAVQTYFNEPATKLTIAQSAMLAAMINEPGFFDPTPHTQGYAPLVARWHYVLTNMVRDGAITRAQANAQKFPKIVSGPLNNGWSGYRGYIMQAVDNELQSTYGYTQQQIDTSGLKIVTTFKPSMMRELYRSVAEVKQQMSADGQALPWYAHVGAILEKPSTGAILAMYGGPGYSVKHCNKYHCQLNMAMQSRNQVGSSFKPYVLATAVHEGMDVQNSVMDGVEPMCVPPDTMPMTLSTVSTSCPPSWFPVNIAGENQGPLTVANATALSSDPGFEDLIHRAGTQNTINMAKAFGVDTGPAPSGSGLQGKAGEVGIALGTASLTVEEQATTFATLADDGVYHTPHVIAKITQSDGHQVPLRVQARQVLTQAQAADVDYALSFDTVYGTAYPNAVLNPVRPTIGKTGTTDEAQSAFFIGAIPQYSLAVGMFTNQQNELPNGQTLNVLPTINGQLGGYGGAWPATLWKTYMQNQFAGQPVLQLPTPDYTGFTRWVQAKPKPKPKKPKRPNPRPSCSQNGPPRQRCRTSPSPHPSPSPTPTSPSPSPTCTRGQFPPCSTLPPGNGQAVQNAALLAPDDQAGWLSGRSGGELPAEPADVGAGVGGLADRGGASGAHHSDQQRRIDLAGG